MDQPETAIGNPTSAINSILMNLNFLMDGGVRDRAVFGNLRSHFVIHQNRFHGDLLTGPVVAEEPRQPLQEQSLTLQN